jgi:hypothetical protein
MGSEYTWILIAALIGAGIVAYDLGRRRAQRRRRLSDPTAPPEVDDNYLALRLGALTETLDHLGLVVKSEGVKAFGLVIDLGLGGSIVTLSTLITGDISLYASDGGGTLGGLDEPEVKSAAVMAIKCAEAELATMTPTKTFPLPVAGQAVFYLLRSDRSVFTAEDSMERLTAGASALSPAWTAAHRIFERLGVAAKSPA